MAFIGLLSLVKLANIACQPLLFISVSLAMNDSDLLLLEPEQWSLASNVSQFRQAFRLSSCMKYGACCLSVVAKFSNECCHPVLSMCSTCEGVPYPWGTPEVPVKEIAFICHSLKVTYKYCTLSRLLRVCLTATAHSQALHTLMGTAHTLYRVVTCTWGQS